MTASTDGTNGRGERKLRARGIPGTAREHPLEHALGTDLVDETGYVSLYAEAGVRPALCAVALGIRAGRTLGSRLKPAGALGVSSAVIERINEFEAPREERFSGPIRK